jgi:hypothetical protein
MADADPKPTDAQPQADDTSRLEAALNRIARHRARPAQAGAPAGAPAFPPALAARLDTLIADLRAILGRDSAD